MIQQVDRKLMATSFNKFSARISHGFCLNTGKSLPRRGFILKPIERPYISSIKVIRLGHFLRAQGK